MPFDPDVFAKLAEDLLWDLSGHPTTRSQIDQAKVRTSISRSYYSVFLHIRELIQENRNVTLTNTARDHALIVDALGADSLKGRTLDRLREKRNMADYNLGDRGFTLNSGQYWLALARHLRQESSNIFDD
ncbi:MAG: hypothetical protein ACOC5K_03770 [Chloroflexota bacterium]